MIMAPELKSLCDGNKPQTADMKEKALRHTEEKLKRTDLKR